MGTPASGAAPLPPTPTPECWAARVSPPSSAAGRVSRRTGQLPQTMEQRRTEVAEDGRRRSAAVADQDLLDRLTILTRRITICEEKYRRLYANQKASRAVQDPYTAERTTPAVSRPAPTADTRPFQSSQRKLTPEPNEVAVKQLGNQPIDRPNEKRKVAGNAAKSKGKRQRFRSRSTPRANKSRFAKMLVVIKV